MKKNVIIFFTAIFVLITFWGIQSQEEVNTIINRNAKNGMHWMINFFFINVHDNKDIKSISTAIIIVITISIIAINIKIPNPKS